jgi:predicted Zn-dependent protease
MIIQVLSLLLGGNQQGSENKGCALPPRFLIGLLIIGGSYLYYQLGTTEYKNEFTGRVQQLALASAEEEVALGLQSAPQMIRESGGQSPDVQAQAMVDRVGLRLLKSGLAKQTQYRFDFHLLNDRQTVNAFALPGGQIFITEALFRKLASEDQLAGVLGHEMGHVVGRHSNEQMANSRLWSGVAQGISVLLSDGNSHSNVGMSIGNMIANMKISKFSRDDELESDALGIVFMSEAGYDPNALVGVMEILAQSAGGARQSEFMSSHPSPENRIQKIKERIALIKR